MQKLLNMKYTRYLFVFFLLGCTNSTIKNNLLQGDTSQVIKSQSGKQKVYNDIDSFKLFCDLIPNVILPIKTNCTDNVIPVDFSIERITNAKYIGGGTANGKIVKDNYILIIYNFDTSGTTVFLKTFNKNGRKIDEISLYNTDCSPTTDDSFDIGYVHFDKNMKITQLDSILSYRTDSNGNQIPGLRPVGIEHTRLIYQLSGLGKFEKLK